MSYRFLSRTIFAFALTALITVFFNPAALSQDAAAPSPENDAAPAQPEAAPAQPEATPAQPEATPAQPDAAPAQPEAAPSQPEATPAQPETAPAQPDAAPAQPDAAPAQPDAAPAQPEATPAQPEATPAQPETSENSEPLPEVADLSETEEEKKVVLPEIDNTPMNVISGDEALDPFSTLQKPIDSIFQLWSMMGISESQWEQFKDGETWNPDQNNFIAQLLYIANRFPLDFILPWTQTSQAAADMLDGKDVQDEEKKDIAFELRAFNRNEQRGALYHLEGTAEAIEAVSLIPEIQTRFEMDSLYFVAVKLNTGHRVLIITSVIPKKWKTGASVSYPVSADAYFLKYGPLDKQADKPLHSYFIATRIAWRPNTPLGNLGMDYGLFDKLDSKPIPPGRKIPFPTDCTLDERNKERYWECYYQELAAVKRALDPKKFAEIRNLALTQRDELWNMRDPRNAMTAERQSYPVESLFNDPIAQRGNLFWLSGRARRIVAIPIEAPDIKTRFGIEQYYQIYLFTPDSDNNPVVINVLELPEGVQPGDGAGFAVDLSVPCFMYNTWMYRRADEAKGHAYQLAPLLFGPKALKMDNQYSGSGNFISNGVNTIVNGILLLIAMVIVFFFVRTLFAKPTPRAPKEENFQYKPHDPNAAEPGFDYQFQEKKPNYKKSKKRK